MHLEVVLFNFLEHCVWFLNDNVCFGNNTLYFLTFFSFYCYRNTLMLEEVKGILQIPSFLSL